MQQGVDFKLGKMPLLGGAGWWRSFKSKILRLLDSTFNDPLLIWAKGDFGIQCHGDLQNTPNSHDQFLNARQLDKATVQITANASDPHIKALIVQLLNENQPHVDTYHASKEGQALMKTFMDKKRVLEATKVLCGYEAKQKRRAYERRMGSKRCV